MPTEFDIVHDSDCLRHNAPALKNAPCSCGALRPLPPSEYHELRGSLDMPDDRRFNITVSVGMVRRWLEIEQDYFNLCPRCKGTGAVDAPFSGSDPNCPDCDGEGRAA